MTTNHPAHGPVSLDRLHQIREHLLHDTQYSNGGNRAYILADVLKVIDGAIAAFGAEPVSVNDDMAYAFHHALSDSSLGADEVEDIKTGLRAAFSNVTAKTAPRFIPAELTREEYRRRFMMEDNFDDTYRGGWNACRAAMLQAGNFREIPDSSTNNCREISETSTNSPALSPIDHGYRPDCECSGCIATARICAELAVSSQAVPDCWCRTCRPVTMNDMRFVVCPDCGNKRCPRANDHRNACTGSNELGQEGSAYPAAPQQEVK